MALHINGKDHVLGPADAPVELIEYADYQCPYCQEAYYVLKKIQQEMGDNLKFVFRNFPLTELHPDALHAAIAAEAAASQNKFWDMHDILFENQEYLDDSYLIQYAKIIQLNVNQFEKDFGKDQYLEKIRMDSESGVQNGVEGTPAFFVNGRKYDGNWMEPGFLDYLKSFVK